MEWLKSSFCEASSCVEVNLSGPVVFVRDSKDREGPVLCFTRQEWTAFLDGAKGGDFDL